MYEQISSQIKASIMSGELKAGDAIPSVRSLAKSLPHQHSYRTKGLCKPAGSGFIETTAGKGCYVLPGIQDFYLEEQQKKIEEKFAEAIEIARASGNLSGTADRLAEHFMYQEDDRE